MLFSDLLMTESNQNLTAMLYTKDKYPPEMEHLSEEVRRMAIKLSNEMIADNDVRYHKDFIILMAIEKAMLWARNRKKEDYLAN